jgi:hypothetical protein
VPVGTVIWLGTKPKNSSPFLPATPTLTVFAGGVALGSCLDTLRLRATWRLTAFLSAFAEGTLLPLGLTLTVPVIPAWMLQ